MRIFNKQLGKDGMVDLTLDGRFLTFTGLEAEKLRESILAVQTDDAILSWVNRHAKPHSEKEKAGGPRR